MTRTDSVASTRAVESADDELLTVRELGAMLKMSPASVYRLVEQRLIPFYRLPHKLRFRKNEVDTYLRAQRVDTIN